jgi:hypothetical protein
MQKTTYLALAVVSGLVATTPAHAGAFSSYECDANLNSCTDVAVSGGNFDIISNTTLATQVGGLEYETVPADTLTLAGLTNLSAVYNMVSGPFEAGSPRFTLFDDTFHSAYIYWGTPTGGGSFANPFANGVFGSTGNLADLLSADIRVYSNGFNGQNTPNTGETFNQFVLDNGSAFISFITLDLDAGFYAVPQELLVSSFTVNSEVDVAAATTPVPEPITLSLFGAGLAGAVAMRRRKKKH